MCRQARAVYPPRPDTPRAARQFVQGAAQRWSVGSADQLALVTSELVTNAVLHARTPLSVSLELLEGAAELAVADEDPRPPVPRPSRHDLMADLDLVDLSGVPHAFHERDQSLSVGASGSVAAGRGLLIVAAVAEDWGVRALPGGKQVWARLPVPNWPYVAACTCRQGSATSASGRRVVHIDGPWDDATGD